MSTSYKKLLTKIESKPTFEKVGVGNSFHRDVETKNEKYWKQEGGKKALRLFHAVSSSIPAYADVLKKNKIDISKINSIEDFKQLPILTKHNYIESYPLKDRIWEGKLSNYNIIATSSGTTGSPVFWPRSTTQEQEAKIFHELIYKTLYSIDKKKTLIIIGYPMGAYVSGVATLLPTLGVGSLGYPVTVISPGMNKTEILRVLKSLSRNYDQTVLIGHPFFLKDVLESASSQKIKLKKIHLKLLSCSEAFNEKWRSYVTRLFSPTNDTAIFNTYGSSELLLIGSETNFTVNIKKELEKNIQKCKELFDTSVVPSLFQYNPLMRYIEEEKGELLFTVNSGVPLIRYALGDRGSLLNFDAASKIIHDNDHDDKHRWKLPIIALRGRSDNAVVFYGANIYVEHIHAALEQKNFFSILTGKFRMHVIYSKKMDAVLEINVELREGVKPSSLTKQEIEKGVAAYLLKINMEYRSSVQNINKDLTPQVNLHMYQSLPLFAPGMKTKFIIS